MKKRLSTCSTDSNLNCRKRKKEKKKRGEFLSFYFIHKCNKSRALLYLGSANALPQSLHINGLTSRWFLICRGMLEGSVMTLQIGQGTCCGPLNPLMNSWYSSGIPMSHESLAATNKSIIDSHSETEVEIRRQQENNKIKEW